MVQPDILVVSTSIINSTDVADKLDCMVQPDILVVSTSIINSTDVAAPVGGCHRDGQRSHLGQVGHDGSLVVGGKVVIAGDGDSWPRVGQVAVLGLAGGARDVGVVVLAGLAEQLDVVVGQRGGGALTSSIASTHERVGHTRCELLWRQLD